MQSRLNPQQPIEATPKIANPSFEIHSANAETFAGLAAASFQSPEMAQSACCEVLGTAERGRGI